MGILGVAHKWFSIYLSNRAQCVDIAGTFSDLINLDISVIKGSTLEPILFLYAILISGLQPCSLFSVLWFCSNKMALNTAWQNKFMIFRTRGKPINENDCHLVYNTTELGHETDPSLLSPVERVHNNSAKKSFKLLGVYFDEYLSFDSHANHLCMKMSKSLYCLNKVKNFVSTDALEKLYFALVHSSMTYCINVYGSANKTMLQALILKQKKGNKNHHGSEL